MKKFDGKNSPLIAAAALVGTGLVLRSMRPKLLDVPKAGSKPHFDQGKERRMRQARDGIATFLPKNLIQSIGNSLLMIGGGIAALRVLDELVDEDEKLF